MLSVTTFCIFVREFSPLDVCAGSTEKVLLAGSWSLAIGFGPAQWRSAVCEFDHPLATLVPESPFVPCHGNAVVDEA